jgi:hypothetical protein
MNKVVAKLPKVAQQCEFPLGAGYAVLFESRPETYVKWRFVEPAYHLLGRLKLHPLKALSSPPQHSPTLWFGEQLDRCTE